MDVHRIEGIKYNFDRLETDELETMRGNLNQKIIRLMGEMALIEQEIFTRHHEELPYGEMSEQ